MQVIRARNAHEALPEAVHLMTAARREESRNGPVLVYPEPVTTVYSNPRERVVFWPERDANPFFHFYEALWMISGREDVASLTRFVKTMSNFSDNGLTFHGAYGYRWRKFFHVDQLNQIAVALRANPHCRRQVLEMWYAPADLVDQEAKRDVPCNLVATFQVQLGALDLTVFCRSNDVVWGCYGANAVHFSMLQEVMAAWVGVPVGRYTHVSVNWHAYPKTLDPVLPLAERRHMPAFAGSTPDNPYVEWVTPFPMVNTDIETWLGDLEVFLDAENKVMGYRDVFFRAVALPMVAAHDAYRALPAPHRYTQALAICRSIKATDWRNACEQWLQRRMTRWQNRSVTE